SFFVQPHATDMPDPVVGLTLMQWLAVILCCIAAVALNFSGTHLRRRAIFAIAFACVVYSLSDWNIGILVNQMHAFTPKTVTPFYATALSYILTALIALIFLPAYGTRDLTAWRDSIPWALAWFLAMIFLYTCFGLIGPVLGNILQSSRGLISILLGTLFVHLGHLHIEPFHDRRAFLCRLAAGILMFVAVILYALGR
ncbi:MAG: hypothetical protein FWD53_13065, partial [Phycisphaerales bacterium]|nr:hypothetical protein [Phycisphaerales bacterium]